MTMRNKVAFMASPSEAAQLAYATLCNKFKHVSPDQADVIVALGGDGFMLETLHKTQTYPAPIYGLNRGTVGFLMNNYSEDNLLERVHHAIEEKIHPLKMQATCIDGQVHHKLAINEVSLLRAGPQAAKLQVYVDGKIRMQELVCDGALVSTPAGSTAYNYSAHGPILPIGSNVLALTAMAAFRPRRWRGALLPQDAHVEFKVLEPQKRPVMADADGESVRGVETIKIQSEPDITHRILFDPGHGLNERLLQEQFT